MSRYDVSVDEKAWTHDRPALLDAEAEQQLRGSVAIEVKVGRGQADIDVDGRADRSVKWGDDRAILIGFSAHAGEDRAH